MATFMTQSKVCLEIFITEEEIEIMKRRAEKLTEEGPEPWTWQDVAYAWARVGICDAAQRIGAMG